MFGRRRSFKVAPGIRVNTGKRGVTSVNVAGVRMGSSSRRGKSGGSKPTKAEQLAEFWRLKPGLWYVRFDTSDGDSLNLEVRGSELTYDRFKKLSTAAIEKNGTAEARIFRQFVASWDLVDEKGKVEPITAATLHKVSNGFFFGLTVEIVNALKIPKKPLDSVLLNAKTDKPYPIRVSNQPFPEHITNESLAADPQVQNQPSDLTDQLGTRRKSGTGWIRKVFIGLVIVFVFLVILTAVL